MKAWKPEPPPLGDKLADWQALSDAGGEELLRDRDVLDVGPFWGIDAALFAPRARSYTAIDSADAVLDQVHRIAPSVRLVLADLLQPWPFEPATFDTVLDFSTLDDVGRPDVGYLEAARVLRPGGTLLTCFANSRGIDTSVEYTTSDPEELRRSLEAMGFEVRAVGRRDQARAVLVAKKHGVGAGPAHTSPRAIGERIRDKAVAMLRRRHDTDTAFDLRDVHALAEALIQVCDKDGLP